MRRVNMNEPGGKKLKNFERSAAILSSFFFTLMRAKGRLTLELKSSKHSITDNSPNSGLEISSWDFYRRGEFFFFVWLKEDLIEERRSLPRCLCSGQTCQESTYEIKSQKDTSTGSASADSSACVCSLNIMPLDISQTTDSKHEEVGGRQNQMDSTPGALSSLVYLLSCCFRLSTLPREAW